MKKIIMAVAAIAMAVSMFAVDFSATVKVKGDIVYGDENVTSLFAVDKTNQKDNDLLEINFNGDKAGAFVRFWSTARESALTVRALKVWFQPIDWLKITAGNNDLQLYTERLDYWKVPCGASLDEFGSWDGRWASGAGVHENFGLTAELTPVDGLYIGFGGSSVEVDADGNGEIDSALGPITFVKNAKKPTMNQMGAVVKYNMDVGIPLGFGAAFRYTSNFDLISIGAEFGNYGTPYYGFLQAKLRLDSSSAGYTCDHDKLKLAGVTIDNYISYNLGFMTIDGTFPITIRGLLDSNDKADASYMTARLRVQVPVSAVTIYGIIGSDEGFTADNAYNSNKNTVWRFDDFGGSFNFYGKIGTKLNVGVAALDVGFEFAYDKPADAFNYAVPFTVQVAF